jgi:spore coat protein U-like protein
MVAEKTLATFSILIEYYSKDTCNMKRFLLCATALATFSVAQSVQAADTESASVSASATVSTVCALSTTPLGFGEVSLTGVTNGSASVTATCTDGGAYDIGIDDGLHADAGQRKLVSGDNSLNYDLYSDASYGTRWGNIVGTSAVSGTGDGTPQELQIYGQIAASQAIVSGNGIEYADTVAVTITY